MGYKKLKRVRPQSRHSVVNGIAYDSGWEVEHEALLKSRGYRAERNTSLAIPYYNPVKRRQAHYIPDFLVHTPGVTYLQEVKPLDKRQDPEVQAKARAGVAYCAQQAAATGRRWRYAMVLPGQLSGAEW